MDLGNEADSVADVEQCLDSDVLDVGANEAAVLNMIVHVFVDVLRCVAVMDQAITEFVQELEGRNFNAVELAVAEQGVDGLLGQTRVLL